MSTAAGQNSETAGAALPVALGGASGALSGFFITVVSARSLSPTDNTLFLTFWAALFAIIAIVAGLQNEVTRAVRRDRVDSHEPLGSRSGMLSEAAASCYRTSPVLICAGVGVCAALLVLVVTPLWLRVFHGFSGRALLIAFIALGVVLNSVHLGLLGVFAGRGKWKIFGTLTSLEPALRFLFIAVAGYLSLTLHFYALACVLACGTWLLLSAAPGVRALARTRINIAPRGLVRRLLLAMIATGASALLINGFPLLMSLTTEPAVFSQAAPLIQAVSVTRAPLMLPLVAFQSMVITVFVQHPERTRGYLLRLAVIVGGIGGIGALAAAACGPWLMAVIFGPAYANTPLTLGLLVLAAACLALLTLTGAVALAADHHRLNILGWCAALLVSVALMLLPLSLETRTVASLVVGPLLGSICHILGLVHHTR
ncbi:hypothetical protein [Actinotignum schaalii]|uniref:Polysaccharide biosynthesis protein C-terminal domain-containing protein n=1 Tax=Actinotignum schaalii FB123-CNA-2 TaxID=883067 RepID=S2VFT7_9ACTO|nr:hypothetical protein [Actinotignum schaalii]EPD26278.1 hypothetical protein HMPREF9237_01557 [Actinotignum schaalii FB123-CNA-2]